MAFTRMRMSVVTPEATAAPSRAVRTRSFQISRMAGAGLGLQGPAVAGTLGTLSSLEPSPPWPGQQAGPQATPREPREPQASEGPVGARHQQVGLVTRLAWDAGHCRAQERPLVTPHQRRAEPLSTPHPPETRATPAPSPCAPQAGFSLWVP